MKRLFLVLATLAFTLAARSARAGDFFSASPGPLTGAHADLDTAANCTKCHELTKGVTDFLCLDCHQHRPLRDAIAEGRGLHATFKGKCRTCHQDHKGRDALIVDWGPVGGRQSFKHEKTGFSLSGLHEKVACTACHKRKLKSGRTSFVDAPPTCDGCHKNPHKFTSSDLREACTKCHKPGESRKLRSTELPFDHEKRAKLSLSGKHGQLECIRCHENAKMTMPADGGRTCASCHKSPHGKAFAKSKCSDCHKVQEPFPKSAFDHDATGFPLRGRHDTKKCFSCHKKEAEKPSPLCQSCHHDPHKGRFAETACKTCHGLGGSKKVQFAHDTSTKFPLTGKHATLGCRSCHRGTSPKVFEKFATTSCRDCHQHTNAHNGEFAEKSCLDCHREGGSKELKFDHTKDTRFATTGFHRDLEQKGECTKCHPKARTKDQPKDQPSQFRTGKLACADCHQDSHKGELGRECQRCHAADVHFKETGATFDHDRLTRFPLVQKHKETKCEKCHENRIYKNNKLACFDCHAQDEPHQGRLGKECDRCHTPTKGAPKFDHEKMTSFERTGAHLTVKCAGCHKEPMQSGLVTSWGAVRTFPVPGKECKDCHPDPHGGRYGLACQSCHDTKSFGTASRAVHDTGAFRLEGTHDLISCQRCHEPKRPLAGLGALCGECHRAKDVHNNALGEMCGTCHSQIEWLPARFNHGTVGFPLKGAHLTARCVDCHTIGVYAGTPRDCSVCHMQAAMRVSDPRHTASLHDCQNCHTEVAFSAVRRYHPWYTLIGQHAATRCSACHVGGQYPGTPQQCVGCHRAQYLDPGNRPNHIAAGFSDQCEMCHTPAGWIPARAR